MSFRRKRKVSAPGRLGSPVRLSTTSPPHGFIETPQPHQRQLLSRKISAFETRRIHEQLQSPIAEITRAKFLDEIRCYGANHVFSEVDEGNALQNIKSPVSPSLPQNPGEIALLYLMNDFIHTSQAKIKNFVKMERPLSKSLQRGEDPQFDQLLSSLSSVAEHCLSSLLKTLFMWYERQSCHKPDDGGQRSPIRLKSGSESPRPGSRASFREKDILWERRDLAVEFIFCLVLIEVLKQLSVHPVDDLLIQYIENLAFKHFKENRPNTAPSPVTANQTIITALYAEVIGVLAQTRFQSIRKRFMQEYKDNIGNMQVLLNIIIGLKYIRIKLYPVDEVEESFLFLQECAGLFFEKNTDKEIKYAFASLFVEILIPVAATAKREYSIPAVKKFVDILYKEVFDMSKKAKHSIAMYPLVTALLCISQKQFFLTNWGGFLNMCLNSIKSRDVKMQRMAMECLYRLLWVYIIRIKCESHSLTSNRLRSIVDTLFPKNSRTIIPRNIPLTIFVKIIQFIAQEKLDFAMQDIIFDLLNIGKSIRQLNPERMNIGLRAFLVIADNLQRKEGSPPMPSTIGQLPSGNTLKVKKTFTKLTEEAARNIGVVTYYTSVRRALDNILKALDTQVGKSMTLINPQMVNKEANDMITGERKSKIDLFRTCVAAIPKCIPDGMNKIELVELVSRLTLHVDEELRNLAFAALQGLIVDFPEYRKDIIDGYIDFSLKEVQDGFPQIIENSIRMLAQMLIQWRNAVVHPAAPLTDKYLEMSMHCSKTAEDKEKHSVHTLHAVEGFALAMLCSIKAMHRKLALTLLKELRLLYKTLYPDGKEERAIDIIEGSAALVIEKALVYVSNSDKSSLGLSPQMDLQLLAEKSALLAEKQKDNISNCISRDLWSHCLAGFLDKIFSHSKHCSCSFQFTWPHINSRLFSLYSLIDPSADFDSIKSRSIISFKAPRTQANLSDLCLWRNYLIFLCCTPPTSVLSPTKTNTLTAVVNDSEIKTEVNKLPADFPRLSDIFRTAIMLIRSESYEIREAAVTGLGKTNASAHPQLIEELQPLMREVLDRKAEGVRKKRKRDLLRLQVARIFAANAEQGCFRHSLAQADNSSILQCLGEYIEGMRTILESENEKDDVSLTQLRLYFSKFLHKMIKSIPTLMQGSLLRNQGRHHLFLLLASWCGHFNVNSLGKSTKSDHHNVELELSALEAMCALLCCGQVFDQKALTVSNGYLYKLLDTMLVSTNLKVNKLGQETVELLLENNESIPALLNFVVDRCYTGERGISNGCFLALANVFSKRPYACQLIPLLCVVLFKTGDPNAEIREKAAQLICILDRRFFGYMVPFRSATAAYAYGNQAFSLQLAFTHPELTLPLLSEMTLRFESATMVGQRCLLQYLVPWLKNVELINISSGISPSTTEQEHEDYAIPENSRQLKPVSLHGDGWGSVMASQMVLNNLFYLSVKYEEYYSKEIEECWSALCVRWEKNVSEILNYLIVMAGLCGIPVLMHAKKVAVYIARAKTEEVIVELTEELKVTDIVTNFWDRIDSPPYFKSLNKCQSPPTNRPASMETSPRKQMSVDSEPETRCESPSLGLNSRTSIERLSFGSAKAFAETVLESAKASQIAEQIEQKKNETGSSELWMLRWAIKAQQMQGVGLPLPMPHELQYFAPIIQVFPVTTPPAQLYRCNFSLMLLAEIVSDRRDISWIHHLPLLLHVSFLGLDHAKPLVHENCKRLIINLLVVLVCGGDRSTIAKALMDFQTVSCTALNLTASMRSSTTNNDDGESNDDDASAKGEEEGNLIAQADVDGPELEERGLSIDERAREVIEYLAKSDCKPLWAFEDITPRNVTIKSADQLEGFLHIIMTLFDDALPHALLPGRWGREALHWATSCSSRHYAGRSFQIFRSLKVPLSWPMLSDILQRLVESVADNSDDVQGYFMEILMTFLAEVDYAFKERPKSVLEQIIIEEVTTKRSGSLQDVYNMADAELEQPQQFECNNYVGDNQHMRSQSIDIDLRGHHRMRSSSDGKKKDRRRYDSEMTLPSHVSSNPHPLTSSVSSKELTELQLPESPYDMLARLFWIGVSLLESDYEHEFLLAIKLLEKILDTLNLRSSTGIDRVERVLNKLNWNNFPGVQSLLLKGLTSFGTAEQTLGLLSKLTALTSVTVIDPAPSSGLSMNVIALLPRLIIGFEEPDEFCKSAATNIMQACGSNGNLHDLGLILTMYRDKEYSKSVQVWIEVVCKNIIDAFPQLSAQLLALLVEMLEQGPPAFQQAVLNIICAILKYADASAPGLKQFHGHLLRIITSHVKDVNLWKDSLNILKLVVSNASHIQQVNPTPVGITSSQLVQPRGSIGSLLSLGPKLPWGSNLSLGDNSWSLTSQMFKKELPGRTLEFSYNVANTPVIGAKYSQDGKDDHENGNSTASAPCWRKPHNSQRRTRERLIQLLPLCGHKGGLKQSLSVIFSSSSEIEGEHALSSENTSGDEQSGEKGEGEFSGQQLTNIFTDFDFLYDEIDEDVEIGSFGWTSTTELHDEEFVESGHISPCGSESDQVTSTKDGDASADVSADEDDPDSLQRSLTESSLRSLKEEESDVVDSPPSLPLDSADGKPPTPRPSSPENDHETPSKHPSRPLLVPKSHKLKLSADEAAGTSSPTSQSSFDSSSGVETSAVAPLQQPPDFAVLSYDEIPDRWTKLMSSFVSHPSVEEAIDSLPCFPLVLKSWSIWLLRLTREASQVLINSPIPEISGVLSKLANIEESLENELRLPYIFVDRAVFSTGKLLLKHRLTVLKLNVGLQGLHEKREQAREHLDLIQATKHEFSSEEELSELFDVSKSKPDDQTVMDFCTCLYRLHMQYVMCLELYLAYVEKIVAAVQISAQITDVTVDLVSIRSELMASQNSTNNHDDSSPGPVISFKETADLVSDAVANRHFDEAITILRAYRQRHPSLSTYEIRPDEEIETILSVYARSILKSRSGVFALLGSYEQLTLICDKLSELLADYLTVIYDRSKTIKPLEDSDDMQLKMDEASSPLSEETI